VSPRHRTPAVAVWTCIVTAFALAIWSRGEEVIVSISTIGFYASYGLPIILALRARKQQRLERGPWHVGRWSATVNAIAVAWIAIITIIFMLPPNQLTGYTFAGVLVLLVVYDVAWARRHFTGPAALKSFGAPAIPTRPTGEKHS
jgi:amino acid transporter